MPAPSATAPVGPPVPATVPPAAYAPACAGATTTPAIVAAATFVTSIVSDGTTLYWADNAGTLHGVPVGGGAATVLASDAAASNEFPQLALAGGSVYFGGGANVERLDESQHSFVVLASQEAVMGVAVGSGSILFANAYEPGVRAASGSVDRIPVDGGSVVPLASQLEGPGELAIDDVNVYWVDSLGAIKVVPLAGGSVTTLVANAQGINGIAVSSGYVYWTNFAGAVGSCGLCPAPPAPMVGDGTLNRMPVSGGATTVLASGYGAEGLAVDATHAYWSDGQTIAAVPLGGGAAEVLADEGAWVGPVIDACYVYWVDTENDAIKRIAKPR
jgi:hypothetical protein